MVSPSTLPSENGLNEKATQGQPVNALGSQIIRELILPELEREVNEGKNFANLRQMYSGMVLATWYKKSLKESLFNHSVGAPTSLFGGLKDKVNFAVKIAMLA